MTLITTPDSPAILSPSIDDLLWIWHSNALYSITFSNLLNFSGDITISGLNVTISNHAVTNTKLAQAPANTIKGNATASPANVSDLTVLPTACMPGLLGEVTNTAGNLTTAITANVVTNGKLAQVPANTIKGNATASPANVSDLTVLPTACMPGLLGEVTNTAGNLSTTITANAVTNAKLAQMAQATIKGRAAAAGTGDPADLSASQVKTALAIDHGADLTGLADDDHTQYALLAGRAGGQALFGGTGAGDTFTIQSTSNATKGVISIGNFGTGAFFDEVNSRFIVGGSESTLTLNGTTFGVKIGTHTEADLEIGGHRHANTAGFGASIFMTRSRGTEAAQTIVQNNDVVMFVTAAAYDGTDYAVVSQIISEIDGVPGSNDMPGRLRFLTTADGASTATEAMRINSDQSVQFSTVARPDANDGATLGTATISWSDLFLATGAVINYANGNYTITHSSGDLAFSGIVTLPNTGLHLLDTNASHDLIIASGSDLTADRTLTLTTGDASRTLTLGADSSISGTAYVSNGTDVIVADGGTGRSSHTAYAVICGGTTTTAAQQSVAGVGTSGQVLTSNGASNLPTFQDSAGGVRLLSSGTVSAVAVLDLVLTSYSIYRALKFVFTSFVPVTDDTSLFMRFSTDGGTNYDAGLSDYAWTALRQRSGNVTPAATSDAADSEIEIAGSSGTPGFNISNDVNEGGVNIELTIYNFTSAVHTQCNFHSTYVSADQQSFVLCGTGRRVAAQNTDAVRFLFESGNIASGNYAVYGYL